MMKLYLKYAVNMFLVWVAIEPLAKVILVGIRISLERTMLFVAERFLKDLVRKYDMENIHFR
jgi:hypothetical protein